MKLQNAIDSFLQEQKARGNINSTIRDYERNLSYFVDFCGDIDILTIDKSKIIDYIVYLREKPKNLGHKNKKVYDNTFVSSVTIQSYVRHLKVFLTWCYENDFIKTNLSAKIKLPKAKKELIKILSDEEIKAIFNSCKYSNYSLRDKLIISLMLHSGLRASEVALLKKSNYNAKTKLFIVFGKGQKERIVPIGKITSEYLDQYIKEFFRYRNYKSKGYLFEDYEGNHISYNAIRLMIDRVAQRSNVKRLHPHLLRHTFATRYLIKTKGDITSLKAILGHTSLKVVENYLHLAMSYSIGQYREFCD